MMVFLVTWPATPIIYLFILIQIYTTLMRFDLISFVICDYKYKVYGTDQGFWKSFSVNCNVFILERLGLRRKHWLITKE